MHGSFSFVLTENTSPDRVTPYAEESLRSIITRFIARTGHESPRVLNTFFEQGVLGHSKSEDELAYLAEMLGYPLHEVLVRNAVPVNDEKLIFARVSIGGQDLQASYYSRMGRAVSPASLRKLPYHRHYWDISPLGFCPESLEVLIYDCPNPQCGRPLTWGGTSVCHCHRCGYDLRNAKTKRLKSGDKYNLPVLAQLFSLDPKVRDEAQASLPAHLRSLKSTELLSLILFFGGNAKEVPTEERNRLRIVTASGARTAQSIELMGAGLVILKYLDEYIFDMLDMVLSERWGLRTDRPYLHELGTFTHIMDPKRQEESIRKFVKPFVKLYFNRNYERLRRKCLGTTLSKWSDRALEIKDAMSEFPLSRWECNRLLQTDYASVGARIGKTEKCLDRDAIAAYLQQSARFRRFRDITRDERVPFEAIANLAKVAGFSPVPPELVGPIKKDSCPRDEWDAFKQTCESNIQPCVEAVCNLRNVVWKSGQKIAGWIKLIELLASGEIVLAGINENETEVASRWLVSRQKTLDAMGVPRPMNKKGGGISNQEGRTLRPLSQTCREIGVRHSKASELVMNGFLRATTDAKLPNKHYVDDNDLIVFKNDFVAVSELSKIHGLAHNQISAWLNKSDVHPIKGRSQPIFFRRSDVQNVVNAGIKTYGHISCEAKAGKVAYLQFYDLPSDWTAQDLMDVASKSTVPIRRARLESLANMLRGMSPHEATIGCKAHKSTLINEWIPTFRTDGLGGRTAQVVGKTRMTKAQRVSFEKFSRNLMIDPAVRRPEITQRIQTYVKTTFGIDYHKTAIRKLLKKANIEYPKLRAAKNFSTHEVAQILKYSRAAFDKVRAGELMHSTETIRKWAEKQFNVAVTRSTISLLLRQNGLEAPSPIERSSILRKIKTCDDVATPGKGDRQNIKSGRGDPLHKINSTETVDADFWDLNDQEWQIVKPLLPRGSPIRLDDRNVISAVLHILGTRKPWRELPAHYGAYPSIYNRFHQWRRRDLWLTICDNLRLEFPTSRALEALSRVDERLL